MLSLPSSHNARRFRVKFIEFYMECADMGGWMQLGSHGCLALKGLLERVTGNDE